MTPAPQTRPTADALRASTGARGNSPAEKVHLTGDIVKMMGFAATFAACFDCAAVFETMADAEAHARDVRHRVECECRSAFTLAPSELLDGVR